MSSEASAQDRRHSQRPERISEQQRREDALRHVAARDVAVAEVERHEPLESANAGDILGLERRDGFDHPLAIADLREGHTHRDERVRIGIRKWPQHEAVDEAADEPGSADAERDGEQ